MTDNQWNQLLAVVQGKTLPHPPAGFIIDCPWLPNWAGRDVLDYFTDEGLWFEANRKAILGNVAPREVLAKGSAEDVRSALKRLLAEASDPSKLILSCASGMPPGVSTKNTRAFIEAAAPAGPNPSN
jgi:hypothetical protein